MASHRMVRIRSYYVFCVKATGVLGLCYLPLLAFIWASGLIEHPAPKLIAGALTALSVPICLMLLSDSGWPRFALRPRSIGGGLAGFLLLSILGGIVLAQAFAVLAILAVSDVLAVSGLDTIVASVMGLDPLSELFRARVFRVLFAPLAVVANAASLLALVVRFDPPSDTETPSKRGAGVDEPDASPVAPVRVRSPEHAAAAMAMRKRMAERQAQAAQVLG